MSSTFRDLAARPPRLHRRLQVAGLQASLPGIGAEDFADVHGASCEENSPGRRSFFAFSVNLGCSVEKRICIRCQWRIRRIGGCYVETPVVATDGRAPAVVQFGLRIAIGLVDVEGGRGDHLGRVVADNGFGAKLPHQQLHGRFVSVPGVCQIFGTMEGERSVEGAIVGRPLLHVAFRPGHDDDRPVLFGEMREGSARDFMDDRPWLRGSRRGYRGRSERVDHDAGPFRVGPFARVVGGLRRLDDENRRRGEQPGFEWWRNRNLGRNLGRNPGHDKQGQRQHQQERPADQAVRSGVGHRRIQPEELVRPVRGCSNRVWNRR